MPEKRPLEASSAGGSDRGRAGARRYPGHALGPAPPVLLSPDSASLCRCFEFEAAFATIWAILQRWEAEEPGTLAGLAARGKERVEAQDADHEQQ
jgi:hypothetical protein